MSVKRAICRGIFFTLAIVCFLAAKAAYKIIVILVTAAIIYLLPKVEDYLDRRKAMKRTAAKRPAPTHAITDEDVLRTTKENENRPKQTAHEDEAWASVTSLPKLEKIAA